MESLLVYGKGVVVAGNEFCDVFVVDETHDYEDGLR
jgi:hypothetical protein